MIFCQRQTSFCRGVCFSVPRRWICPGRLAGILRKYNRHFIAKWFPSYTKMLFGTRVLFCSAGSSRQQLLTRESMHHSIELPRWKSSIFRCPVSEWHIFCWTTAETSFSEPDGSKSTKMLIDTELSILGYQGSPSKHVVFVWYRLTTRYQFSPLLPPRFFYNFHLSKLYFFILHLHGLIMFKF